MQYYSPSCAITFSRYGVNVSISYCFPTGNVVRSRRRRFIRRTRFFRSSRHRSPANAKKLQLSNKRIGDFRETELGVIIVIETRNVNILGVWKLNIQHEDVLPGRENRLISRGVRASRINVSCVSVGRNIETYLTQCDVLINDNEQLSRRRRRLRAYYKILRGRILSSFARRHSTGRVLMWHSNSSTVIHKYDANSFTFFFVTTARPVYTRVKLCYPCRIPVLPDRSSWSYPPASCLPFPASATRHGLVHAFIRYDRVIIIIRCCKYARTSRGRTISSSPTVRPSTFYNAKTTPCAANTWYRFVLFFSFIRHRLLV